MVVGGSGKYDASFEMIDLEEPGNSCTFKKKFPIFVKQGIAQQTPNGIFYCGGADSKSYQIKPSKKCFKFERTKFVEAEFNLTSPRSEASSVLYEDSFVVIAGTGNGPFVSKTLEVVPENKRMQFPVLPRGLQQSCAVVYKKNIIIYGGDASSKAYDKMQIINSSTVEEKSLKYARRQHGCTIFRFQQKDILVVAGGYYDKYDYAKKESGKSTEFVILNNNMEFQEGKSSYLKIDRSQ